MDHGIATLKKDLIINGKICRKKGESGVITAFLPEYDRYAVMFDGKMGPENWFTLTGREFEEYFEYFDHSEKNYEKGLTVKELKKLIKHWSDTNSKGEESEVWIETGDGLSSIVTNVVRLNETDILLESEAFE